MTENIEQLSEKVIECATCVHDNFGPGFPEKMYQDALSAELKKRKIHFKTEETRVPIINGAQIGAKRIELMIEECIMVELKALQRLEIPHIVLFTDGLKKSNLEMGLLLNFGGQKLQVKKRHTGKTADMEE